MQAKYDVIVIGLGSMGAAACYHLAQRGVRVLGIEQYNVPHTMGAHHGHSRMIRLAYFEHPDYVPLLRAAYEGWRDIEKRSGQSLLYVTGGLYMGPENSDLVGGALRSCQKYELAHEILDPAELKRRFSQFRLPSGFHGLYEPEAGYLLPEMAVTAFARMAMLAGAELHGQEAVIDWKCDERGVTVTTSRGRYQADRLVLAAGAWSGRLLRRVGVTLKVTRQVLAWFWPRKPELFSAARLPVWFIESEACCGFYGFPMFAESLGFKVALHKPGDVVTTENVDRQFHESDVAGLREFVKSHLPDAEGPLLSSCVCLYTHSPDSHFIVDLLPGEPRVAFACGFSGHGFKFASVIGKVLCELSLDGTSRFPIEFLQLSRFTG